MAEDNTCPDESSNQDAHPEKVGAVTQILGKIASGDQQAAEELLPLVYEELRKLAADKMAREKPGQTLQSTALVHEAYLRLVDVGKIQHWDSRGHFFSAAAEAMRRILVDRARHKDTQRAGGDGECVSLEDVEPAIESPNIDLLALNEALEKLERTDPRRAELVKLRFFGGLTVRAAAATMGIALSTAHSDWAFAKAWLRLELSGRGVS
jgi:RNA polymerase sigma factor (TIGR02999 family)